MYLRVMPALVAVPAMALAMAAGAGVPPSSLAGLVTTGAVALAPVYVAVVFGALLGRVTIETGIARRIVNLAAEYGGERPYPLALGLGAIVAVLFTSISGLGGIIMVGSIVLPIMMTAGVPRKIAANIFIMSFALGYIFNITNWTFYTTFFGVTQEHLMRYAVVLAIIDAIAVVVYASAAFLRQRHYATWAIATPVDDGAPRVPAIALVAPVLPLILYYALKIEAAPAFLIAAVFAVLVTKPRLAIERLVAAAIRGVEDVAPAIVLFMGIGILLVATKQPQFGEALRPVVAGNWLRNPLAFVAIFGFCSPLVLYRGPLNPFGVGIAIFTVLLNEHVLPAVVLVAAVMAVVQVQNVCDPTNTANVWIANFTGVPIASITRRLLAYQMAVAISATVAIVVSSPALFGKPSFTSFYSVADAAELFPGFFVPLPAAQRIDVDDDGSRLDRVAADAVAAALATTSLRPLRLHGDPNVSDCASKPYAAYVHVVVTEFHLLEGDDVDAGLRLEDCGGWIVEEWHDHEVVPAADVARSARELALAGVSRLIGWARAQPARSSNLFGLGAAVVPVDPPAYFYALFRTPDGNMRLYVRAGGPAWYAGLRSNDVVMEVDGREWWYYGTYPTEQFAYDRKPHTFTIVRDGTTANVALNAPFVMTQR
jgi:hypothetical protein